MCYHGVVYLAPYASLMPINVLPSFYVMQPLLIFTSTNYSYKYFHTKRILATQRIGPHNEDVLSTLVGSLLGDAWAENRSNATRFHIHTGSRNVEYLHWLHQFFAERGYCSMDKVIAKKQIGKQGKIYFSFRFRTLSYSSLNWLYDLFYEANHKRVPETISEWLTPRALAIWIMDDGRMMRRGVKISTEGFALQDIQRLQQALQTRYSLCPTIQRHKAQWVLYFPLSQLPRLSSIVKPLMIPCMYSKLNGF
jgi:ubiquinol-cytochrome c reductase cytochrome b subunit